MSNIPWSSEDATRFKKDIGGESAKHRWAEVANSVLGRTNDEGKAIKIANSVTKSSIKRRMEKGKVRK